MPRTRQDIVNQIAQINTILSDPNYLRTQSYTLQTGQGQQSATYRTIGELRALKDDLEYELGEIDGDGLVAVDLNRNY